MENSVFLKSETFSSLLRKFSKLCLLILYLPSAVSAQESALESCYKALIDARNKISGNVPSEQRAFQSDYVEMAVESNTWSNCVVGKSIPSLDFVTIKGKSYKDSDLRGKVLVINFWFKSCAPCVAEMPSLNKLYTEFKGKDVVFIGFATDREEFLKPIYLNSNKFLFDIVPGSTQVANQFKFFGYPTTYIVDQKGVIVKAWTGYSKLLMEPYDRAKPVLLDLLAQQSR